MNTNDSQVHNLAKYFLSHNSDQAMQQCLKNLLTPAELEAISTRLEIVRLLKSGLTQREVAKQLGVGIATVTRGSKALKSGKFDL